MATVVVSVFTVTSDAICCGRSPGFDRYTGYVSDGLSEWIVVRRDAPSKVLVESFRKRPPSGEGGFGVPVSDPMLLVPSWADLRNPTSEFAALESGVEHRRVEARGWPWVCMLMEYYVEDDGVARVAGGIFMPFRIDHDPRDPWPFNAAVPLRPIWNRALLNILFWGAAGACFCFVCRRIVSARRISRLLACESRGNCGNCGYVKEPHQGRICSECGCEYLKQVVRQ